MFTYMYIYIYIYIHTYPEILTPNLPTKIARLKLSRAFPVDVRIPRLRIKILLEPSEILKMSFCLRP